MVHHYVYITTNNISGKKYIGKHSSNKLNNYYLGSGRALLLAIKKYGRHNFTKKIVATYESEDEAYSAEYQLINEHDAVVDENYYNLSIGGKGGISGGFLTQQHKEKISKSNKGKTWKWSEESKRNIFGRPSVFKDKQRSDITKKKMSDSKKGRRVGEDTKEKIRKHNIGNNNPNYGSRWINNGIENKKISANQILPEGWIFGRLVQHIVGFGGSGIKFSGITRSSDKPTSKK